MTPNSEPGSDANEARKESFRWKREPGPRRELCCGQTRADPRYPRRKEHSTWLPSAKIQLPEREAGHLTTAPRDDFHAGERSG